MSKSKTLRLFLALPIPNELKKEIKRYQKTIAHLPVRLTPPENLHVTLIFLGETSGEKLVQIGQKIQDIIYRIYRSRTSIDSPYFFIPQYFELGPNPHTPRLIWLTLKASPAFLELQRKLAKALDREEKRPFTVHVTVARFDRTTSDVQKLKINNGALDVEKLSFLIKEIHLMKSKLERGGAKYTIVKHFPLPHD